MKSLFQKTFSLFILLFIASIPLIAQQIGILQYRVVHKNNIEEFVKRETTYWAQVASKAIKDGKLVQWELWQRYDGFDLDENSYNFVLVNIYADKSALDELGSIWNAKAVFPNIPIEGMETRSISDMVHRIVVQFLDGVGRGGNYARVNYDKLINWQNFLKRSTEGWKPFIEDAMKNNKTSFVGWSMGRVVMPRGTSRPFDVFTVDQFDKLSEAVLPTWPEGMQFPNRDQYEPSSERVKVETYRLVKRVME